MLNQGSQPIRNLAGRPRQISAAGFRHSNRAETGTRSQWFEPTGGPVDRGWWTWVWTTAAAGPLGALDLVVSESPNNPPVIPGQIYSTAVWVMTSITTTLRAQAQMLTSAGGNAGTTNGPATLVPANVPTLLVVEGARALSTAVSLRTDVDHVGESSALWQVGDSFKLGAIMPVDGPKAYKPVDGWYPGWRFDSPTTDPAGSQSAGYPYTLVGEAGGTPFLDVVSSSNQAVTFDSRSFPNGVSLYTVVDRPVAGDTAGAAVRDNASTQRLYSIGSSTVAQAAGQVAGVVNQTAVNTRPMPNGLGVIGASMTPNQSTVRTRHNSDALDVSTSIEGAPGTLTADRVAKSTVGTGRHIRQIVFDRYHDPATAAAVIRFLCHEYGLPFAA